MPVLERLKEWDEFLAYMTVLLLLLLAALSIRFGWP